MRHALAIFIFAICALPAQYSVRQPAYVALLNTRGAAAGGGSCPGTVTLEQDGASDLYILSSDAPYVGQNWNSPAATNLCKVSFKAQRSGDLTGSTWAARIYAVDGSDDIVVGSPIATSDNTVSLDNTFATHPGDWVGPFTFNTAVTLAANTSYAIVLYDTGGGSATKLKIYRQASGGTVPGRDGAWLSSGVGDFSNGTGSDCAIRLWMYSP